MNDIFEEYLREKEPRYTNTILPPEPKDKYSYPVILTPEAQDHYFTICFPDLNITREHILIKDRMQLHEIASNIILIAVKHLERRNITPPKATPISNLKVDKCCYVYKIITNDSYNLYLTQETPQYKKTKEDVGLLIAKSLMYIFFTLSQLLYAIGFGALFNHFEFDGITFYIPLIAAFLPPIMFFLLLNKIHTNDEIKGAYFCNMAIIALIAGYGLFQVFKNFTPEPLCWILSIAFFIGMMFLHKMNDLEI